MKAVKLKPAASAASSSDGDSADVIAMPSPKRMKAEHRHTGHRPRQEPAPPDPFNEEGASDPTLFEDNDDR